MRYAADIVKSIYIGNQKALKMNVNKTKVICHNENADNQEIHYQNKNSIQERKPDQTNKRPTGSYINKQKYSPTSEINSIPDIFTTSTSLWSTKLDMTTISCSATLNGGNNDGIVIERRTGEHPDQRKNEYLRGPRWQSKLLNSNENMQDMWREATRRNSTENSVLYSYKLPRGQPAMRWVDDTKPTILDANKRRGWKKEVCPKMDLTRL